MEAIKPDLDSWLSELADPRKPFTFSRWGDGEWRSLLGLGANYANCDGHHFFPEMGLQLQQVLQAKPVYRLGMQSLAVKLFKAKIEAFLQRHALTKLTWYDADVFHKAAIYNKLDKVVEAVSKRKVLLVGPAHLRKVPFPVWKYVQVQSKNVYQQLNSILMQLFEILANETEPLLISVSASMPAEIIVDELYKRHGGKHTIIDFGSLWDQLVGVKSRSYMRAKRK